MIYLSILFSSILFAAPVDSALKEALQKRIYEDRYWALLLHYSGGESEIEDDSFFISENGRVSKKDELVATIKALYGEEAADDNSTACRYPARKRWLVQRLDLKDLPEAECREYEKILKRVDPESATLVFPSAHINSPASMFGHTFVRINSSYNSRLLSYAVNYAADADPNRENGVVFALKGLFGGYDGKYSLLPYYDKLKEYRDTENRDIWEYDLNLTKEETLRMFEHIWEVKDVRSPYYFFTRNCSYEMLWLLEAARPGTGLRERFIFEVIPLETVHAANGERLVASTGYRPSKRSKIEAYKTVLESEDIAAAKRLARGETEASELDGKGVPVQKRRYILEASIELVQYYYQKGELEKESYLDIFHNLTSARAALGKAERVEPKRPPDPLKSHRARRVVAGAANISSEAAAYFGFRPAYHDLTDPLYGFLRGTQIEFMNIEGYVTKKRARLEKATILSIESLTQSDEFFDELSWRTRIGWHRDYLDDKSRFSLSVGAGLGAGNDYGYIYAMIDPQLFIVDGGAETAVDAAAGLVIDRYSRVTNLLLEYRFKHYEGGRDQNILSFTQNFRVKENLSFKLGYRYIQRETQNDTYDENSFKLIAAYYF